MKMKKVAWVVSWLAIEAACIYIMLSQNGEGLSCVLALLIGLGMTFYTAATGKLDIP